MCVCGGDGRLNLMYHFIWFAESIECDMKTLSFLFRNMSRSLHHHWLFQMPIMGLKKDINGIFSQDKSSPSCGKYLLCKKSEGEYKEKGESGWGQRFPLDCFCMKSSTHKLVEGGAIG